MKQDKKKIRLASLKINRYIHLNPKQLNFIDSQKINYQQNTSIQQKRQTKFQNINQHQLRTLQYLLLKSQHDQESIKNSQIRSSIKLENLQKNKKSQDNNNKKAPLTNKIFPNIQLQRQIWQQAKMNANVINMELIFAAYKTNYNKIQDLKKKFSLFMKQRQLKTINTSQLMKFNSVDNQQKQTQQLSLKNQKKIAKLPKINQVIYQQIQQSRNQKIKQNQSIQLNNITTYKLGVLNTKLPQNINKLLQNQYINIQKLKANHRKQFSQRIKKRQQINIQNIKSNRNTSQINLPKKYLRIIQKSSNIHHQRPNSFQNKEIQSLKQFSLNKRNFSKKDHFVFGLNQRPISQNKIELYRDFLWKINMTNSIFIQPQIQLQKNYKIYIGKGNNSMLIRGLIKRRFWWTIIQKFSQQANFVWAQLKNNQYLKLQKTYIRQQNKTQSTLFTQCNSSQLQLKKQIKNKQQIKSKQTKRDSHQNIFSENDLILWNNYYIKNRKIQQQCGTNLYLKRAVLLKNKNALKIYNCQNLKVHNHFNSNFFIGNKKALFYSMRKYYQLNNLNVFQYLPLTFHISKGQNDPQYKQFFKYYQKIQQNKNQNKNKNIWIVKPGEFTNRGTGITVCASLDDIKIRLRSKQKNQNGKLRTFIVQKYIQRPFLYHKRKFDIRHYMMMTCINGSFKGYWYQDGYIRTTSYQYNTKNCKDNSIHLTNDAIQKYTQQYGKYEKGNKISYQQFQKYLDHSHKGLNFFDTILPKMKKICSQAIRASYFLLDTDRKTHNFEIFGMDFMIDEDFNPWLIQINTNPCLELSSPLLTKIIPAMVENSFKIGLDPLFQPPYNFNKKYQLGDNPLQTNKFCIIFDENYQGQQIQQLYKNIDKIDKNMGQIQQQDEQYQDQGKQWNQEI